MIKDFLLALLLILIIVTASMFIDEKAEPTTNETRVYYTA